MGLASNLTPQSWDELTSAHSTYGSFDIGFFIIGKSDLARRGLSRGGRVWISPGDHKLVGTFLAEVRKERGISQVELAHRLGKPQSFVSSYERGQRRVDFLEYAQIANALGIDARAVGGALVNEAVAYIEAQLKAIR